jgi:CzcA family heavy metal efflux pump
MTRWIVESSLKLRFLVLIVAAALLCGGLVRLRDVPVDVFPEFAPPYVEIQTESLGLSAAEVESLVTVPMEELLHGVPWLKTMRSQSVTGLSSILLIFEPGTDIMRARALVQERLTQANGLPTKNVSKPPVMLQPRSSTNRVMMIGLSSRDLSLIDLSVLTRWTIKPRLLGVPGVANVSVWGQRQRQLQVQVDPERLRANGVTMEQIVRTAGNSLWISPLGYLNASTPGVTGGFIDTPTQRLGIRHVLPISNADDLSQVIVADAAVHLGEVATVVEDHQPLIGDAVINDGPGLLLTIEKLPTGNTLEVTRGVDKAIDSLRPALTGVEINTSLFRPATFIEQAVDNLAMSLLIGCLLMVLVLGAFLFQWRTALISVVAIPLSLVAAGLVLQLRGATINTMILAGFVVALGSVVDDAIIDVENIMRRLRQARRDGSPRSIASIVLEASLEVRGAIIFATLIIVLAVAPVLFLDGLSGSFFQPLAVSYALALLVSMLVALTVTPALSLILLARAPLDTREPPLMRWLAARYQRMLLPTLHRPRPALLAMGVLAIASLAVLPFLGQTLLPGFKEHDFLLHWGSNPGTSLPEMTRITTQASRDLRAQPGVRNFAGQIGRAVQGDEIVSINSGVNWVSIDPKANYDASVGALQRTVESYPGLSRDVVTYLQERIRQVLTGTGSAEPIVVRVFGTDLDVLRQKAEEVRTAVAGVDGVGDAHLLLQVEEPTVEVKVDLNAIQPYGLKPGDVRRAMATLVTGIEVGNLFEQEKVFDVVVTGTADARHSLSSLQDLIIEAPTGGHVRVGDIASVRVVSSPNMIKREGASRYIDIGVGVTGRDLGAVARDVQARMHNVQFPREFHAEFLGEYAEREAAQNRLLIVALAAVIGIFLLLQAAFGSWKLASVAFVALPTALFGGVLAAFVGGGSISLGSLVGFLTVLGIAARNGIMLILHYQHLEVHEAQSFGLDLVLRGARERLAPIVMTAAATGLALVPLVVAGNVPGHEIEHPMAIVILGGLASSTLLNLFLLPALYLRFGARAKQPVAAVEHAQGHLGLGHGRLAPVAAAD